MASFEELLKKARSGQSSKPQGENTSNSFEDLLEQGRKKRHEDEVKKVDDSYINLFVKTANDYFNSANDEFESVGWGNASNIYKERESRWQDLDSRSQVIRSWLDANKDSLDADSYNNISGILDYFGTNGSSVLKSFSDAVDYFKQWDTEEKYNEYLTYKKDYDEKAGLDLDAATKEIEELNRRIAELEDANRKPASSYLSGGSTMGSTPYGAAHQNQDAIDPELAELYALRNQKQQYYTLAKRIQDGIELSGAVNNADFDKYNGYVSTESDSRWGRLISDYSMGYDDLTYEYINGSQNGMRSAILDKARAYGADSSSDPTERWTIYDRMDETEISIYNYYYAKEGKEAAEKYLDSIQETLNHREGASMFANMEDNTLLELAFGVAAGLDQFESGMKGAWSAVTGKDDYIPASSMQIASGMVREDLADAGPKMPDWMGGGSLGQVGYDAITTTANMAPSILASVAIGTLNPMAGSVVGQGLMGTSAAGNAYQEKLNLGYTKEQARTYGIMVGASEVLLEKILGGISSLGGGMLPDAVIKNLNAADNVFSKFASSTAGQLLIKSGSEAIEEGLQEVLEPFIWQAVSGEEAAVELEQALYSALLGFVTGGVFEGGNMAVNTAVTNANYAATGEAIMGNEGGVDALMKLANDVAGVSEGSVQKNITKQSGKVEKNATARSVGKLYDAVQNANNTANASANQADIAKSLERKGFNTETAQDIAEALVASYNGQELTSSQQRLLKSASKNSVVQAAIRNIVVNPESTMGQRSQNIRGFQENYISNASRTNPAQQSEANAAASGKVDAQNNNGTESHYEVSADGKTIDKAGNDVKIIGVESVENGKMILKTENGTIDSSEVLYASKEEGLVYEAVANIDASPASAWAMIKGWDQSSGVTAQEYATDLKLAYTYGKLNYTAGLKNLNTKAATAFQMGRSDAEAAVKTTTQASTESTVSDKNADKQIIFEGFTYSKRKANGVQKASMEAAEIINKMSNLEVHVYKSYKKSDGKLYAMLNGRERLAPNGYFTDGNKIYIDFNAGNKGEGVMLYTMSHEIGHYIAQWNAQDFKAISDFLFEHYGEDVPIMDLLEAQEKKLKKSYELDGKPIPSDAVLEKKAQEELVCDMLSRMLADKNAYDKLMELKQKDLNTFQKLGQAIKKVLDKLGKLIGVYDIKNPDFQYAASVETFGEEAFRQLQDLYLKAFVQADANFQSAMESVIEADAEAVSVDEIITDGAVVTDGQGMKFSLRSMKADIAEGQMFEDLKNVCGWTQRQVNELKKNLEDLVAYMTPFRDILDMNESYGREGRRISPYKPNSDPLYKISMDFSTLCSKRLLTQYVIENLQLRENRPMSAEEQMAIRDMLNEYRKVEKGLQVACAMCYVEAARLKSPKQITKWMEDPGTQMKNYFADKDPEFAAYIKEKQADFKESRGYDRNATKKGMSAKDVKELNKIRPRLRSQYQVSAEEAEIIARAQALPNSTYLTAGNLADLSESDPVIYSAYTAFVRTATRSKSLETDEPYYYGDSTRDNGNGIIVSDSFIEAVNRENGMRFSSWSDWRIQHLLDYITAVIDNSVRGAAMHGYTKFGEEVRVLGKTGMMFNMSGVAGTQTGLNEDGSLSFSSTESIDVNEAIQLREEFPETAGLQCIGVSDDHIVALLRSDIIDYIIPYHVSGLNADLRRMAKIHGWDDYTDTQHAAIDKNLKLENAVDKEHWHEEPVWSEFFVGYNTGMSGIEAMRATAENYKQMCKDRGLTPKFNQFVNEDNYWKLLIDRKMINQKTGKLIQQKPVTPTFDFGTIKEVVDRYVQNYDSGLEARALNHIVENWDSIPNRIKDLKKQGGTKAKKASKAVDTLANQTLAAHPAEVKQSSRDYARQVDEVKNNTHDPNNHVYMGTTPTGIAKVLDLPKLPMLITPQHIYSMGVSEAQAKQEGRFKSRYNYHNLGWDAVKKLPEYINKPVLLIKSNTDPDDATFVVVTAQMDNAKNPIIAAVKPNGKGNYFNIEFPTNFMLSGYGKDGIQGYVARAKTENRILYANKNSQKIKNTPSVQFADNILSSDYTNNLADFKNIVNSKFAGTIFENSGLPKFSDRDYAPTFYSHMAKVVDGVKQEKLGAASVVSMLRGKGVKVEEIKWSGIEEWLAGKKSVTKAELQEFIAGSMLQIEEDVLNDQEIPYSQEHLDQIAKYETERDIIAENLKSEWKRIVGTDIPITYFGAGLESAVVNNLLLANSEKKGNTAAGYQYKAKRAALQRVIEDSGDYFGFDNARQAFREALRDPKDFLKAYEMTSFQEGVFKDFIKAKDAYGKVEGIPMQDQKALKALAESADRFSNRILKVKTEHRTEAAKYLSKYRSYTIKGGTNYRELLFRIPGSTYSNGAMNAHWERSGVLAHARMQDLNTFLGKMLFIEEIQSDWHNEGHKSGYTSEADVARISEIEDEIAQILTEKDKIKQEHDAFLTRYWEEDLSDEEYNQYMSAHRNALTALAHKQRALEKELYELSEGNDVPDAPFKDTYHEYVLKRLLRMAAEQDYDSIGWTPAEIQVDRWSEEFAEGYRIEYDQDIPKFLNKYGKKWGTKVGKTVLDSGTEVWSMAITDEMKESVLTEGQPLYSERDTESVSNRSLLANALEGAAKNEIELNRLQEYKSKISLIEAEERKLGELTQKIKDLSFAKGPKDTKAIRGLQFEANQTANRISTYDKQLLRLEASKPLQDVLTREKKLAYKRAEQKGKEALAAYREKAANTQRELMDRWQESRKKGIESREKTAMRHKIKDVVNELNQYLLKGTKDRHVPIELQKAVAEALDAVNMDTVGAEERIAKLQDELMKAKTPEQIQEISRKIDHIREMGDKMNGRLKKLKVAYDEIINSDDPLIANSHDDGISAHMMTIIVRVGDTPLRDMTIDQLQDVYDVYRMVLTTIRNANKAFKAAKSESISVIANRVMEEVEKIGGKKQLSRKGTEGIKSFMWNNLKPVYAFAHIGSDAFTEVFNNVRAGEDVWALDVTEAREYYLEKSKKHKYDSWDFKKRFSFQSTSGMNFSLGLEQIMSLYAYSKRDQAAEHLKKGGIVIDETTEITVKNKLGIPVKFNPTEATAYNISDETLTDIISKLTDDQKGFVDEMQDYLSTVMGAKGNEVSLVMYGVKLFKEKFYFPLKSAHQFMAKAKEQQKGEVKIKNSGFSKETVQKASNPIVLTPFMNVWADHVNEMSMYHAFVLPMEDFYRVYNYRTPTSDTMATESVEMFLQNAYGKGATKYIDQLLKDLNGGARPDSTTGFINKMMGLFKKGSVFASMSVVVQQPSAIARAAALLDLKYFIGPKVDRKRHKLLWDEVKQYAPVAIIKEMGYFDTNMGKSTQDFILGKEYSGFGEKMKALVTDSGYRDEILSKAPALADELAWCSIWEAVKRETKAKNPGMDVKSEAFLKKAGERFTEVIVKTQVYDSVLSRSANMRSKDTGMKMATAFMAEPTTSINMIADALLQGKRGNRKYARAAIGSVIASQILNSILVSFVYAGRDDDEDKTYWEKYIGTLTGEVIDSLNPATYIPFIKDIVSIVQGYDVERSDMAVISDLWKAYENLSKDYVSPYRKVEGFAGSIAQIFGLPVKNIMRDVRAIYQTVMSFMNGQQTTKAGIGYAVKESIPKLFGGGETSNQQQLYDAILSGDKEQLARVQGRYADQTAINSAIRKALRENDSRIKAAAVARVNGNLDEYMRLAKEIIKEGHFSQDNVVAAINAEINAMSKEETSTSTSKASGLFKADDFALAIAQGDNAMANAIKKDIIQTAQKNGKTAEEAENSFNDSASDACKELFLAGEISERQAVNALRTYCGKTEEGAMADVQYWAFKQEYPDVYADDAWFDKYYEDIADSGIRIDVYMEYRNLVKGINGKDKKERRLEVIDSMPITSEQKDAMYFAEGWAESKLSEAPWH